MERICTFGPTLATINQAVRHALKYLPLQSSLLATQKPLQEMLQFQQTIQKIAMRRRSSVTSYAIITELRDLSKLKNDDEVEINYLKKSNGKWVIVEALRMVGDLTTANAAIDGRSWYTIMK